MNITSLGFAQQLRSDVSSLAERVRRSVVEVRSGDSGCGAGIVWAGGAGNGTGLIVTNAHCVPRDSRLFVLHEGTRRHADVVAYDRRRDLALLSTASIDAPPLELRAADSLHAGELVFAHGHPLAIRDALTMGVIHGVARDARTQEARFVVADVRLAPGNSGGPLVDSEGRLVGINSMVMNGLGVAVPADVVHRFLDRVLVTHAA